MPAPAGFGTVNGSVPGETVAGTVADALQHMTAGCQPRLTYVIEGKAPVGLKQTVRDHLEFTLK